GVPHQDRRIRPARHHAPVVVGKTAADHRAGMTLEATNFLRRSRVPQSGAPVMARREDPLPIVRKFDGVDTIRVPLQIAHRLLWLESLVNRGPRAAARRPGRTGGTATTLVVAATDHCREQD